MFSDYSTQASGRYSISSISNSSLSSRSLSKMSGRYMYLYTYPLPPLLIFATYAPIILLLYVGDKSKAIQGGWEEEAQDLS